jgi:hypothetical protein
MCIWSLLIVAGCQPQVTKNDTPVVDPLKIDTSIPAPVIVNAENVIHPIGTTKVVISWTSTYPKFKVRALDLSANNRIIISNDNYLSKSISVPVIGGRSYSFSVSATTAANNAKYGPEDKINFSVAASSCVGSATQSCSITNGTGIRSRTCTNGIYSAYGSCTLVSCNSGYQAVNGICTKIVTSCVGSATQSCTIANGTGSQSRTCTNGVYSAFGSCVATGCNSGYEAINGVCTPIISTSCSAGLNPTTPASIVSGSGPNWPSYPTGVARGDSTDPFANELPITRWATVSFQTYSERMPVGLVAFHGSGQKLGNEGIEKVEFIANNGQVTTVVEPTCNPKSGLWEWWAYLEPLSTDGPVEVRAIIYPFSGIPRTLQGSYTEEAPWADTVPINDKSLVLWSNKFGTFTKRPLWVSESGNDTTGDGTQIKPFRSIGGAVYRGYGTYRNEGYWECDGCADFGTIYLTKGTYPMHNMNASAYLNRKGWFTIEAAPGENREDVIIGGNTEPEGSSTRYRTVHFKNVSFDYNIPSTRTIYGPSIYITTSIWLEGVSIKGVDAKTPFGYYFSGNVIALTASDKYRAKYMNFKGGPGFPLVSGVDVSFVSADVFTNGLLIRDWNVSNTIMLPEDHPDLWQSFGSNSNRILMDGKIIGGEIQLIFMDSNVWNNTDIAMVNVVMAATGGGLSQIGSQLKHVLFWNIELTESLVVPQITGAAPTFGIFGSILNTFGSGADQQPNTYQWSYNQFGQLPMMGSDSVLLNPEYDASFVANKAVFIPKRTVRWDRNQKPRNVPYYTGAHSTPGGK